MLELVFHHPHCGKTTTNSDLLPKPNNTAHHMTTPFTNRSRSGLLKLLAFACASSLTLAAANAQITTVIYILLENRCLTSGTDKSYTNILYQNKNGGSPYITAMYGGGPGSGSGASANYTFSYQGNTIQQAAHVSVCSCYHHDFATYNGTNVTPYMIGSESANTPNGTSVHPSEPNYVFMEAGSNLSKLDDNDPYLDNSGYSAGAPGSNTLAGVQQIVNFLNANPSFSGETLSGLLQNAGISWTSYTEGTCLLDSNGNDYNSALAAGTNGTLTNNISPLGTKRTVPLVSFSGTNTTYTNPWNGTHQFNFAAKHTGQLFFAATNGGTVSNNLSSANLTPQNVEVSHYAPFEQLASDLSRNTQAAYCVLTPDQYNDGHTALSTAFVYNNYGGVNGATGPTAAGGSDIARIEQMDSFCSLIIPTLLASPVYQAGHTAIVVWTDETEGSPQNDFYHTLTEFVYSPYCKGNSYNSTLNYTHSTDVATMQEIFGVTANTPSGYLNDAANLSNATPTGVTVTTNTGQGLQVSTSAPFWGFGSGGAYGNGQAQDFSDLFVPGTLPALPGLSLTASGYTFNKKQNIYTQTVTVTNTLSAAISNPIYLVVGNLANTTLKNSAGTTVNNYPGNPYVSVSPSGLAAGASTLVTLQFTPPSGGPISDTLSAIKTAGTP